MRTWLLQIIQIFIPISFIVVAILVGRVINPSKDLPKLFLSLDSYTNPVTLVQFDVINNYTKNYQDLLENYNVAYTSNITEKMINLVSLSIKSVISKKDKSFFLFFLHYKFFRKSRCINLCQNNINQYIS